MNLDSYLIFSRYFYQS